MQLQIGKIYKFTAHNTSAYKPISINIYFQPTTTFSVKGMIGVAYGADFIGSEYQLVWYGDEAINEKKVGCLFNFERSEIYDITEHTIVETLPKPHSSK